RSLSRRLVMSGVSAVQVPKVIRMCAHAFGVPISKVPSPRSVGRFILEGGIGAGIQLGNILAQAKGVTTSMDSTSQRSINFSSMHIMANSEGFHQQLYLAVESTTNHTSETQVEVLKNTLQNICDTAERAPKCEASPDSPLHITDIARKLYGSNGDHANDQLKVARVQKLWKTNVWIEHLGNTALSNLSETEAQSFHKTVYANSETTAGGSEVFASLNTITQDNLRAIERQKGVRVLGEAAFNQSSLVLQHDMTCVVRSGCCMHKDMNALKGGTSAMSTFWKENKALPQPVTLFNKDNDATISLADSSTEVSLAERRAISVSEAGAIKLCSLAGAAFNHKDDKKGHQDSHAYWFEAKHSRSHRFPDTSNVRYSSYIDAATELCTFHSAYIDYMEHSRQRKATGALNHLEANILKALNCPATLAELIVIALYGQAISKPYMRLVRTATAQGKGIAELAALHALVQVHLQSLIDDPLLLLGPTITEVTGTLDGSEWDNPQVLNTLRIHESMLPYISDLLVAFCRGALQTWIRFTEEFLPGGPLGSLTLEQSEKAFMPPTNDANEGALGTWRVWTRKFPRLALHRFNAIIINRANKTEAYMDKNFTQEQYTWARSEARRIDSSKKEETRRAQLVLAATKEAEKNDGLLTQRAERKREREEQAASIQLELDQERIRGMKGVELDSQLKAYRQLL
ncbi:hypothetical protein BDV93DRAFT_421418, partial [Ceratobasidium sp. AG-I]